MLPSAAAGRHLGGDDLFHTLIYDALVFNACESFAAFPVDHDASIEDNGSEIGAFHGIDNSTLDHTGFYNFSYTGSSDGHEREGLELPLLGKVNVTCSGLNALP